MAIFIKYEFGSIFENAPSLFAYTLLFNILFNMQSDVSSKLKELCFCVLDFRILGQV